MAKKLRDSRHATFFPDISNKKNTVKPVYTGHVYTGISLYRTDSCEPFVSYENSLFIPEISYKSPYTASGRILKDRLVQIVNANRNFSLYRKEHVIRRIYDMSSLYFLSLYLLLYFIKC